MTAYQRVCVHEAGHALAAYRFHRPIYSIEVDAKGSGGVRCTEFRPAHRRRIAPELWNRRVFEEAVICLAGPIAEHRIFGKKFWDGWSVDLRDANKWLRLSGRPFRQAAREALRTTHKLVSEPAGAAAIKRLAQRLIDRGPMNEREAEMFFLRLKV